MLGFIAIAVLHQVPSVAVFDGRACGAASPSEVIVRLLDREEAKTTFSVRVSAASESPDGHWVASDVSNSVKSTEGRATVALHAMTAEEKPLAAAGWKVFRQLAVIAEKHLVATLILEPAHAPSGQCVVVRRP